MAYNNKTYVIVKASQVSSMDFSKLNEESNYSLRYNEPKYFFSVKKTIVTFTGDTPSFLEGKTQYTHEQILELVRDPDNGWIREEQM